MSTAREVLDAAIPEKDFMQQIVDYATLRGWIHYHTHDSRQSAPGFPDLIIARSGQVIAIEVKSEKGKVTDAQREWLKALRGRITSMAVRPSDWPMIETVLA